MALPESRSRRPPARLRVFAPRYLSGPFSSPLFRNRRPFVSRPPRPAPPSVYQPPNAVHCPECDVCVEGYDHHCPWMGTCIGSRNYAPFLLFNLAWLFYLLYAILWVSFVGVRFGILLAD